MNSIYLRSIRRTAAGIIVLSTIGAAIPAQARPQDFAPPPVPQHQQSEDTRLWRWIPRGPRGTYEPVVGSRVVAMPDWRQADRWVGPHSLVPIFDKG